MRQAEIFNLLEPKNKFVKSPHVTNNKETIDVYIANPSSEKKSL